MKKEIENNVIVREDRTSEKAARFIDMFKKFWNPDSEELSQEEEISTDEEISEDVRKELLKALKNADGMIKPTDGGVMSHIAHNLKVEAKESAKKALKEQPIKINTKNIENEKDIEGKVRE